MSAMITNLVIIFMVIVDYVISYFLAHERLFIKHNE